MKSKKLILEKITYKCDSISSLRQATKNFVKTNEFAKENINIVLKYFDIQLLKDFQVINTIKEYILNSILDSKNIVKFDNEVIQIIRDYLKFKNVKDVDSVSIYEIITLNNPKEYKNLTTISRLLKNAIRYTHVNNPNTKIDNELCQMIIDKEYKKIELLFNDLSLYLEKMVTNIVNGINEKTLDIRHANHIFDSFRELKQIKTNDTKISSFLGFKVLKKTVDYDYNGLNLYKMLSIYIKNDSEVIKAYDTNKTDVDKLYSLRLFEFIEKNSKSSYQLKIAYLLLTSGLRFIELFKSEIIIVENDTNHIYIREVAKHNPINMDNKQGYFYNVNGKLYIRKPLINIDSKEWYSTYLISFELINNKSKELYGMDIKDLDNMKINQAIYTHVNTYVSRISYKTKDIDDDTKEFKIVNYTCHDLRRIYANIILNNLDYYKKGYDRYSIIKLNQVAFTNYCLTHTLTSNTFMNYNSVLLDEAIEYYLNNLVVKNLLIKNVIRYKDVVNNVVNDNADVNSTEKNIENCKIINAEGYVLKSDYIKIYNMNKDYFMPKLVFKYCSDLFDLILENNFNPITKSEMKYYYATVKNKQINTNSLKKFLEMYCNLV